jgi:hypothetical protein
MHPAVVRTREKHDGRSQRKLIRLQYLNKVLNSKRGARGRDERASREQRGERRKQQGEQ